MAWRKLISTRVRNCRQKQQCSVMPANIGSCLIPSDGFYEWKKIGPKTEAGLQLRQAQGRSLSATAKSSDLRLSVHEPICYAEYVSLCNHGKSELLIEGHVLRLVGLEVGEPLGTIHVIAEG